MTTRHAAHSVVPTLVLTPPTLIPTSINPDPRSRPLPTPIPTPIPSPQVSTTFPGNFNMSTGELVNPEQRERVRAFVAALVGLARGGHHHPRPAEASAASITDTTTTLQS